MKKIFICAALTFLLIPLFPAGTAANANLVPTLTRLTPQEGAPGQEILLEGMSYHSGTRIIFYALPDTMQKEIVRARLSARPGANKLLSKISLPPGMRQTWMQFNFQVPKLEPGTYWLRLENAGWTSQPLPFMVLPSPPVISSISPSRGDYYRPIIIRGKKFNGISAIRLTPENGEQAKAIWILPYFFSPTQLIFYPWVEEWWPDVPTGRYEITVFSFNQQYGRWLESAKPKEFYFTNNKPPDH